MYFILHINSESRHPRAPALPQSPRKHFQYPARSSGKRAKTLIILLIKQLLFTSFFFAKLIFFHEIKKILYICKIIKTQ